MQYRLAALWYPPARGTDSHFARAVMDARVAEIITSLEPAACEAVEISGTGHAGRNWLRYQSLQYPDFDVCAEFHAAEQHDVVICEQVLEHVVDPWAAARTLRRLAKPDGRVIVTVPFLIRIHPDPEDYWRFTPAGLRVLLQRAGLDVLETGSWGNPTAVRANLFAWAKPLRRYSRKDRRDTPVVVWAVARRLADDTHSRSD